MSSRRKYSISGTRNSKTFLSRRDKNRIIRHASIVSSDLINVARNYGGDSPLQKPCNIESEIDYCGFSYYRTDGFQDIVLMKDVGVSCNLLNKNTIESDISISGVENYLIKQLKLEYNELSNITKKLNMYTKDILNNLSSRCRRKEQLLEKLHVASKHVMATQCTDEIGEYNPCLKLRSRNHIKRKCGSSNIDLDKSSVRKEIIRKKMHGNNNTEKRWVEFNKAFAKKFLEFSSKCSSVLLRNYLIMKREKVSSNASKARLSKTENFSLSDKLYKDRATDKSRKCFYASKCNPLVFTNNWQEISKQKNCRSKSAFTINTSELRRTVNSQSHLTHNRRKPDSKTDQINYDYILY